MPDGGPLYPPGIPAVFEIARRLRAPDGCPWDKEQTHLSLRPYLLEETYELLEAIDRGDDDKILEELGDVLLQVAMHAAIAEEEGRFDAARVSEGEAAKMVFRHPHVFASADVRTAEEVLQNWEHQKQRQVEKEGSAPLSPLERVPSALPALAWVYNMQKRAARVGVETGPHDAIRQLGRLEAAVGAQDLQGAEGLVGDLLFAVVDLARRLKVNPEDALRVAGERYRDRFGRLDEGLREKGLTYQDLDREAKRRAWEESATAADRQAHE